MCTGTSEFGVLGRRFCTMKCDNTDRQTAKGSMMSVFFEGACFYSKCLHYLWQRSQSVDHVEEFNTVKLINSRNYGII